MAEIPVMPFAFASSLSCATVILLKSCTGASAFGAAFLALGASAKKKTSLKMPFQVKLVSQIRRI